jgi:hypothetical protein
LSALINPDLISVKPNSTAKKPNRVKTFQKIPTTEKWILWMHDFQGLVTYSTLKERGNIGEKVAALLRQTRILRSIRITFKPRRTFKLIYFNIDSNAHYKGGLPSQF